MGGGRKKVEDKIDPTVGIVLHVEVGEKVEPGERLATWASRHQIPDQPLFTVNDEPVARRAVVIESIN